MARTDIQCMGYPRWGQDIIAVWINEQWTPLIQTLKPTNLLQPLALLYEK